jgi:hypothetical protein
VVRPAPRGISHYFEAEGKGKKAKHTPLRKLMPGRIPKPSACASSQTAREPLNTVFALSEKSPSPPARETNKDTAGPPRPDKIYARSDINFVFQELETLRKKIPRLDRCRTRCDAIWRGRRHGGGGLAPGGPDPTAQCGVFGPMVAGEATTQTAPEIFSKFRHAHSAAHAA